LKENIMRTRIRLIVMTAFLVALGSRAAFAGPPLICFPFDIGKATTLPMGATWEATDPKYDVSRLVGDTVALLREDTPVLIRMETIRRATVYVRSNPTLGAALMTALEERATKPGASPLTFFDLGYTVETFKQANWAFKSELPATVSGYHYVVKALRAHPDPMMEFAAALITYDGKSTPEHRAHLQRAAAAAKDGDALAVNLQSHFNKSLTDLRR
jgi:hypothetical protein